MTGGGTSCLNTGISDISRSMGAGSRLVWLGLGVGAATAVTLVVFVAAQAGHRQGVIGSRTNIRVVMLPERSNHR
mgnify:CR=1 FL=1